MPDGQIRVWDAEGEDWEFRPYVDPGDELHDLIREAHGVMKDLRGLLKQANEKIAEVDKRAHVVVDEALTNQVKAGLDQYHEMITTATEEATQAVFRRFDIIYDTLVGKNPEARRRYPLDVEEIVGLGVEGDKDAVKRRIAEAMKVDPIKGVTP